MLVQPVCDFLSPEQPLPVGDPTYWYEGRCPTTGHWLRLPRTAEVEAIARGVMAWLANQEPYGREGKMYGVLLVVDSSGQKGVLKAFSGLLQGQSLVAGWVPPIPGRDLLVLEETQTLERLERLKQEIISLQQLPQRQEYLAESEKLALDWQQLLQRQAEARQQRALQRQQYSDSLSGAALETALEALNQESRRDGRERRQFKVDRDARLHPLRAQVQQADDRILALKRQRRDLSRQLQAQMHHHYRLTNFAGDSLPLTQLLSGAGIPTGTGDCCAPKLLHYAATQGLQPLALAEFWWGSSSRLSDKVQGNFYPACADRCQPLMGFLLSGLRAVRAETDSPQLPLSWADSDLPMLYADDWLLVVNKPPGLLSVPGRYRDRQDSVLSRLQVRLPQGNGLRTVHRLDQDTSGILVLARTPAAYRHLCQQFQTRQVKKIYEAILSGPLSVSQGVIDLPLRSDWQNRPLQVVDHQVGKPSLTQFRRLSGGGNARIEFVPVTGRTHQLRVHAADPQGLGLPILGDRLYGDQTQVERLYLHARELHCTHPATGVALHFQAETPF